MGNIIKVTLDDKEYILEFNRRIILEMEAEGLTGEKGKKLQDEKPVEFAYKFIRYAFRKNHADMADKDIDEVIDKIDDLAGFIEAIAEILQKSLQTIQEEGSERKNAKWERV